MNPKLDLNECLIDRINYSLSFSLNKETLSVKRVSFEPCWKKIALTGLFFIPVIGFLLATLYCIYAAVAGTPYANNCSEALPFLILITVICLTAIPSINILYSSESTFDNAQCSFIGFFTSKKIQLRGRKPVLTLEIYDSPMGGFLEGKVRIRRKRNFPPWDIHVFMFQTITYPSREIACKNAHLIKEYISENSNSLFSEIKIED